MRLRRLAALVLALCLALGLAGCAGETIEVTVWRSGEGSVALPETKRLAPGTGLIPGAVAALNSTPDEPGLAAGGLGAEAGGQPGVGRAQRL